MPKIILSICHDDDAVTIGHKLVVALNLVKDGIDRATVAELHDEIVRFAEYKNFYTNKVFDVNDWQGPIAFDLGLKVVGLFDEICISYERKEFLVALEA